MVVPSSRSIVPFKRWVPGGCCCWASAAETVSAVARTATVKLRVLICCLLEGIMHHSEFRQASPSMTRAYDNRVEGRKAIFVRFILCCDTRNTERKIGGPPEIAAFAPWHCGPTESRASKHPTAKHNPVASELHTS